MISYCLHLAIRPVGHQFRVNPRNLLRDETVLQRARRVLLEGGFINGNIDLMLSKIEAGTAR